MVEPLPCTLPQLGLRPRAGSLRSPCSAVPIAASPSINAGLESPYFFVCNSNTIRNRLDVRRLLENQKWLIRCLGHQRVSCIENDLIISFEGDDFLIPILRKFPCICNRFDGKILFNKPEMVRSQFRPLAGVVEWKWTHHPIRQYWFLISDLLTVFVFLLPFPC
jgi:hypothetical protein